jgi:hypothetical protein
MANNKTVFVRTEREPKNALRGQAALVLEAIAARPEGGSIETIAKDVTPTLVTRQDPERVVAYYACIFKKQGLVRATVSAAPEVEENDEDTDEDDDEDDDLDIDTTDEVEDEELEDA